SDINKTNITDKDTNKLSKLLTPAEVRDYLHLGNNKLYELLRRKDFPSFQIGSRFYIIEDDFADWMASQCKKNVFASYRSERNKTKLK
ncbi:MAG: helix-turn-helix domain-containing protein, partial [Oscillospiraceae bacterium]|nr:helix-turn-helix domain-containing protein [Oscillospiraceae bacterium]